MKSQWEALYDDFSGAIRAGRLSGGERLPGEHELSTRYGVSRNTVRRALLALSQDGLIRIVNGRGSYVMHHGITYEVDVESRFRDVLHQHGMRGKVQVLENQLVVADAEVAAAFSVAEGETVLRHRTVIFGNDIPFMVTTRYFPADLVEDFQHRLAETQSFTKVLEEAGLGELMRVSTTVGTRLADEREAALLECPRNAPLLDVFTIGRIASGRIVEWQNAQMNGSLIRLSFRSHENGGFR